MGKRQDGRSNLFHLSLLSLRSRVLDLGKNGKTKGGEAKKEEKKKGREKK